MTVAMHHARRLPQQTPGAVDQAAEIPKAQRLRI